LWKFCKTKLLRARLLLHFIFYFSIAIFLFNFPSQLPIAFATCRRSLENFPKANCYVPATNSAFALEFHISLGVRVTRFFLGRVVKSSGNKNCYLILILKKILSIISGTDNLGSDLGISDVSEFSKKNKLHKI
jgi:hypothetical protein